MRAHMPPYTKQEPTGAYRAPAEIPESERKLRTALAYVNHARDLIRDALGEGESKAADPEKSAYVDPCPQCVPGAACKKPTCGRLPQANAAERVPKWDVRWPNPPKPAPLTGFAGLGPSHPMAAETIRDHDDRLAGGEDRL